jgi:hypothetical protein
MNRDWKCHCRRSSRKITTPRHDQGSNRSPSPHEKGGPSSARSNRSAAITRSWSKRSAARHVSHPEGSEMPCGFPPRRPQCVRFCDETSSRVRRGRPAVRVAFRSGRPIRSNRPGKRFSPATAGGRCRSFERRSPVTRAIPRCTTGPGLRRTCSAKTPKQSPHSSGRFRWSRG